MASLARLRTRLPLKTTGRLAVSHPKNSHRCRPLHYRAAFCPLVADRGRLDTTCPINTARSFYAILGQAS